MMSSRTGFYLFVTCSGRRVFNNSCMRWIRGKSRSSWHQLDVERGLAPLVVEAYPSVGALAVGGDVPRVGEVPPRFVAVQ